MTKNTIKIPQTASTTRIICENPDVFSRYAGFTYVQVEDSLFLKHEYYPPKNVPTASEICHEKSFPKNETIPWFLSLPTL